jgi:glycosyltransferase involved in cell wall biosynthesis
LRATAGRASQLNAGARAANGDGFLFLHADTRLPFGGIDAVREYLVVPAIVGGAFRLRLDSSRWPLKVVERAANWRTRLTRIPYGDQAIFVKREVFETLNGFREMEIIESSNCPS